jgi:hypothetical protein
MAAALDRGVRRDVIGGYIDNAKINWTHLALAQLIDHDFVDRVLTTNFDPLVSWQPVAGERGERLMGRAIVANFGLFSSTAGEQL